MPILDKLKKAFIPPGERDHLKAPAGVRRPHAFMEIAIGETPAGRIELGADGGADELTAELFEDITPRTVKNFAELCSGKHEFGGQKHAYVGSQFHRVVPGFMIQGGDIARGDGTGMYSIYGGAFEDENFKIKHSVSGLLSMANSGPNKNGSQFFITTEPADYLDGKHVVFGHVVEGMSVVRKIEAVPTGPSDRPTVPVTITACGIIDGPAAPPISPTSPRSSIVGSTAAAHATTSGGTAAERDVGADPALMGSGTSAAPGAHNFEGTGGPVGTAPAHTSGHHGGAAGGGLAAAGAGAAGAAALGHYQSERGAASVGGVQKLDHDMGGAHKFEGAPIGPGSGALNSSAGMDTGAGSGTGTGLGHTGTGHTGPGTGDTGTGLGHSGTDNNHHGLGKGAAAAAGGAAAVGAAHHHNHDNSGLQHGADRNALSSTSGGDPSMPGTGTGAGLGHTSGGNGLGHTGTGTGLGHSGAGTGLGQSGLGNTGTSHTGTGLGHTGTGTDNHHGPAGAAAAAGGAAAVGAAHHHNHNNSGLQHGSDRTMGSTTGGDRSMPGGARSMPGATGTGTGFGHDNRDRQAEQTHGIVAGQPGSGMTSSGLGQSAIGSGAVGSGTGHYGHDERDRQTEQPHAAIAGHPSTGTGSGLGHTAIGAGMPGSSAGMAGVGSGATGSGLTGNQGTGGLSGGHGTHGQHDAHPGLAAGAGAAAGAGLAHHEHNKHTGGAADPHTTPLEIGQTARSPPTRGSALASAADDYASTSPRDTVGGGPFATLSGAKSRDGTGERPAGGGGGGFFRRLSNTISNSGKPKTGSSLAGAADDYGSTSPLDADRNRGAPGATGQKHGFHLPGLHKSTTGSSAHTGLSGSTVGAGATGATGAGLAHHEQQRHHDQGQQGAGIGQFDSQTTHAPHANREAMAAAGLTPGQGQHGAGSNFQSGGGSGVLPVPDELRGGRPGIVGDANDPHRGGAGGHSGAAAGLAHPGTGGAYGTGQHGTGVGGAYGTGQHGQYGQQDQYGQQGQYTQQGGQYGGPPQRDLSQGMGSMMTSANEGKHGIGLSDGVPAPTHELSANDPNVHAAAVHDLSSGVDATHISRQ